jgi:ribosomal protein L13E
MKPMGDNQGEPAQPAQEKPEQLPTASHAERVAIKKDQQDAMGQGVDGLTKLGLANIHAKQLGLKGETEDAEPGAVTDKMTAPEGLNQGGQAPSMAQGGQPTAPAQPGLKPIAPPEQPNTSSEQGGDFKTRLAQLKLDHAKALALRTPEGKVQADYIQEQINDLHKNNPWGTEGNHPGILGKLGHVAAKVGNIAGNAIAPNIMSIIPGTELNQHLDANNLQHETKQDEAALAAQDKADKTAANNPDWKVSTGAVGPNGRVMLENSKTGEVKEAPEGFTPYDKPAHLGDQGTYIAQWYKDHPDAPKSTENDDKAIEAYGAAKAAAGQENKAKGKVYYYNTPEGRRGYTYGEAKAAGLNVDDGEQVSVAQAEKDRKANASYDSLQSQMGNYKDHIAKAAGQLLPSDTEAMSSVIEATEQPDYVSKIVSGVVDDFYGKPVTGYNEKLMKGALTKTAYDKMSPTARQLVADYFTTLMAHFGNVKDTLGQVPRNEKLITTEMNMIPKPYLNAQESEPAFNNYKTWVDARNSHNVKFGAQNTEAAPAQKAPEANDEHQKFIQSITLPGGGHPADAAKGPNGDTIVWSGKAGDPWVDLATGRPVK